ncbi:cerebellin-1-like [Homarus americanus]|uniref:cerebellin-1-like n=1 Tax=Homarus americanus TaxID=6706 RepID=UPI001C4585C9|nr:cerebellin-1-like [Homarus americanus]
MSSLSLSLSPSRQVGTGWNNVRSEYVAPTSGIYFFTFSAVSDRNTHFRVSLRHNGQDVVTAFGDVGGYQMGSQSAVLRLNSGDHVLLQLQEGRLYDVTSSRAYTTFSGFKIA